MKKRKGSSCLELMVLMAVMFLLITLATVALKSARERSQEAKETVESCTTIDYGSRVETFCDTRKVRVDISDVNTIYEMK